MVFDTETCNCPKIDGQLDTKNAQFYDFGLQIIDINGKVYCEYSIVNEDVFFGMPQAMREAYFADKIPQYVEGIHNKNYLVMNTVQIRNLIHRLCKEYDIAACIAHNARFDIGVLRKCRCGYGIDWLPTVKYCIKQRRIWKQPGAKAPGHLLRERKGLLFCEKKTKHRLQQNRQHLRPFRGCPLMTGIWQKRI